MMKKNEFYPLRIASRGYPRLFMILGISVFLTFLAANQAFSMKTDYQSSDGSGNTRMTDGVLQQKQISGKITDKNGEPLAGVNVSVKGTSIGIMTDVSGTFSLNVPGGTNTVVCSFIGMKTQEIDVLNRSVINVVMEADLIGIKEVEVVAVGYSSKQRSQLSSSVSVVSSEELNDATSNSIGNLLQGKAPGLVISNESGNPSTSSTITIRGSSSITAGSSPLMVVDGIIGGNANPNDVESITILKDAAATGLYGSRASNGVIIITTKSGKAGKTKVSLNVVNGFNQASFGKFKMMNSQQIYDLQKSFWPAATFATLRPASLLETNTDWVKLGFRTGLTKDYTISVTGGSDKTQFYGSANYYHEDGTLNHTGNEAFNIRSNISHFITDKVKLSLKFNGYSRNYEDEASGGDGALRNSVNNMPFDNPYKDDGTLKIGTETGWTGQKNDNFLHGWQYNFDKSKQQSIDIDANLDYYIIPNLTFMTYNRASYAETKRELYYDVRSKAGAGLGYLTNDFSFMNKLITSNRLKYDKSFGLHSINAIAVVEAEKNFNDQNRMYGSGIAPGLHVMDAAATITKSGTHPGYTTENAFSKELIQVDYSYSSKYFAVASLIRESSSRFGANNRDALFYTLGTSWIISNEDFMKKLSVINMLKIRASYGSVGNADISNYQSLGLYSYSAQYAGNSASIPSQIPNPDLTWEKANILDFGVDLDLLKRISITFDWYDKTSNGLLLDVPLPYTSGYPSVTRNVGSIRNRGFEINLVTQNFSKGNFKWETSFNFALNRNKVMKLNEGKDITINNIRVSEGRDLYSWYMRKWAGVDPQNGDPLWELVNSDGTITNTNNYNNATMQFVGTASPDFTGGLNNRFSYKGLSLTAFFNFVEGNLVNNYERYHYDSDGAYTGLNQMIPASGWTRWEKAGDIATTPLSVYGGNKSSNKTSSRYIEDGSYIRLRNITLDYQFPASLLSKVKIASAKIYVSGDNLWTGTRFSGMDPEVSFSMASNTIGSYPLKYPISKKILIGIVLDF
jgi:TonB-linked SusC/RagA family outer membrane protein